MFGEIANLIELFAKTFTETNKQQREFAQMMIYEQSLKSGFLEKLMNIILLDFKLYDISFDPNSVKKSVINYIDKYIKLQCKYGNEIKKQSRIDLFNCMSSYIKQIYISKCINHETILCLTQMFALLLKAQYNQHLSFRFIDEIAHMLKQKQNMALACYFLNAILEAKKTQNRFLVQIYNKCFKRLAKLVMSFQSNSKESINDLIFGINTISKMFFDMKISKYQPLLTQLCQYDEFLKFILKLLYQAPSDLLLPAFNLYVFILKCHYEFRINNDSFNQLNARLIIKVLHDLQQPTDNKNIKLHSAYILYLTALTKDMQFQIILFQNKEAILFNIILNKLKLKEHHFKLIEEDPHQYINLISDLCHSQDSKTFECEVAKFLECLCDKVDGMLNFVFQVCIILIKEGMGSKMNFNLTYQNQIIKNIFFKQSHSNCKAQLSFLMLTMLSYKIQQREEFVLIIENMIISTQQYFLNPENVEVCIQFQMFYCYYLDNIKSNQSLALNVLEKLINLTRTTTKSTTVRYQTYDAIINFLGYNKYAEYFSKHIGTIINNILLNINFDPIPAIALFDQILDYYQNQVKVMKNEMINWMFLISKIMYHDFINPNKQDQLFIGKAYNLFEKVMNRYPQFIDGMLPFIQPSIQFLKILNHKYTDNILILLSKYIRRQKKISNAASIIFIQNAERIIEETEGNMFKVFYIFNEIIINSQNIDVISKIFFISCESMMSSIKKTGETNPLQSILLIHLILFHHLHKFDDTNLASLFTRTFKIIQLQYFKQKHDIYGKYLLVFLQCLSMDFQRTSYILKCLGIFDQILINIYEDSCYYDDIYDAKIYVINQINILKQVNFDSSYARKSLKILMELLYKNYKCKQNQNVPDYYDIKSSSEQQEDDNKLVDYKKNTFQIYISPYKNIDEFILFRNFVKDLCKDQIILNQLRYIIDNLPVSIKQFIEQMSLSLETITVSRNISEVRKILKIKRAPFENQNNMNVM